MAPPEETADLPGFTQPTRLEDAPPPAARPSTAPAGAPSTPPSPAPPTPPTLSHQAGETLNVPPLSPPSSPSPPTSGDITEAVGDALDNLAGDAFEVAGVLINKAFRARTKTESTLWLVSPEESTAFAEAAGRIAARRLPEELKAEGDASDMLVMGAVALGYVAHNAMGIAGAELAAAQELLMAPGTQAAPAPAPAPVATPPSPVAPPAPIPAQPAATVRTQASSATSPDEPQGSYGQVAATPPPPSVITPSI